MSRERRVASVREALQGGPLYFREIMDALGHRARVAVDRGLLAEDRVEIRRGQRFDVERAEALAYAGYERAERVEAGGRLIEDQQLGALGKCERQRLLNV